MEELSVVINPAQTGAGEQLFTKNLPPQPVDLVALGKKPVSTNIETKSFVMIGSANAADHAWICLEDDAGLPVLAELISGGEPGRSAAGDDGFVGGNDGDGRRIINARPAMGNKPRAQGL